MRTESKTPIQDLKGYLKPEQVHAIIDAAPSRRDKLLIETLWFTGARISEVVGPKHGIRPQDLAVDGSENFIIMRTLKRTRKKKVKRKGKTIKIIPPPPSRRVAISRRLMSMLSDFCKNTLPDQRIFPISRQRAFEIVKRAGRLAGITRVGNKGLHPHHFRHSSCIAYVKRHNTVKGLEELQMRMGHASFATTACYLQFSMKGETKKIEEIYERHREG